MEDENKNYVWMANLKENSFSTELDKMTYFAQFYKIRKTFYREDICKEVAAMPNCPYTAAQLMTMSDMIEDCVCRKTCQGNTVVMKCYTVTPTITGIYDGLGQLISDTKENRTVAFSATNYYKSNLNMVTLQWNNVIEDGGAKITKVTNLKTKSTDGSATRGQMFSVEGVKIKCIQQDGTDGVIKLYNENDEPTEVSPGVNNPSSLIFVVPDDLAEGNYRLEIETYFTGGSTRLKNKRTIICPYTIKIN